MKNSFLHRSLQRFAAIAVLLAVAVSGAFAAAPLVPKNFTVSVTGSPQYIWMKWQKNADGSAASGYNVYLAKGSTENEADFEQIAVVREAVEGTTFQYKIENLNTGAYTVFVRAFNEDGEGNRTSIKVVEIKNQNSGEGLKFVTEPKTQPEVGKEWVYEARATYTSTNAAIKYRLDCNVPDGMTIDENTGRITWTAEKEGTWEVCIYAFLAENPDIKVKQIIVLKVGKTGSGEGELKFVTESKNNAEIGTEWVYEARAEYVKDPNAAIKYRLDCNVPDGMTIDENTGKITWTATKEGVWEVCIVAYLAENPDIKVKQVVRLKVGDGGSKEEETLCAYIVGTVGSGANTLAEGVVITIIRIEGKGAGRYVVKSEGGRFSVKVGEGVFAVMTSGERWQETWYGGSSLKDAERITVKCEDEIALQLSVTEKVKVKNYVVRGTVSTATGSGTTVAAYVNFIDRSNVDEKGKYKVYTVKTKENGSYVIELPEGRYIAQAGPVKSDEWTSVYYDGVQNELDATVVTVNNSDNVINFTLQKRESYNNGVVGFVYYSDDNGTAVRIVGKVTLYRLSANSDGKQHARTVETDENGVYRAENLLPGVYIVHATPNQKMYYPGYYKENGAIVREWKEASRLEIGENTNMDGVNVALGLASGRKGAAKIEGNVKRKKGIVKTGETPASVDNTLAGVVFYAVDEATGQIADWGFSDSDGSFLLAELSQAVYTLSGDKPEFDAIQSKVQTDFDAKSIVQVSVEMTPASVTGAEEELAINANSVVVYPNPTSGILNVRIENTNSPVRLSIVNSMGVEVSSMNLGMLAQATAIPLQTEQLSAGAYFVRVVSNEFVRTSAFSIVR